MGVSTNHPAIGYPHLWKSPPYGGFHSHGGYPNSWMMHKVKSENQVDDLVVPLF